MRKVSQLFLGVFTLAAAGAAQAQTTPAPQLEFVFSELVTLGAAITPGKTPYGGRNIIPITGGTVEGSAIKGQILPGGWDWQLGRSDGCTDVRADYMLKTDDGVVINIVNTGVMCPQSADSTILARTHPRFEAPIGKYDWLSKNAFVGTLELAKAPDGGPAVRIGIYRVR